MKFKNQMEYEMYVNDLIKTKEENLPVEIRDVNEKMRKDNRKAVKKIYTRCRLYKNSFR